MGDFIRRLLFDEEVQQLDKKYRNLLKTELPEEEAAAYKSIRKHLRLYQIWRRNVVLAVFVLIFLLLVVVAVGMGTGAIGGRRPHQPDTRTEKQEKETKEQETETELQSETETETETETEEPLAKETTLTLTFTGDCILGTDESFFYDTGFTCYYDMNGPDYFMENVRDIFEKDDITIVNMEGTLTEEMIREPKEFAFKADPEYVKILSNSSVEAANQANNHSHDYGEQSYLDTKNILEAEGIKTFGYDDVALLTVKDVRVGIYGIYELDDHQERIPQMLDNIQKLKDMKADIIIGVFHWSNELEIVPDENALTIGHLAIDNGTDLIVGHHPHVIQGIEEYNGKNIVYSLGNFCFGGNVHPYNLDTFIYQQTFTIGTDRKIKKTTNNIIPCWISSEYTYNNYQPTPMTGEEAEAEMEKIKELSKLIGTDGSTYYNPPYDYYNYGWTQTTDWGAVDYGTADYGTTDWGYTDGTDYGYTDYTDYGQY